MRPFRVPCLAVPVVIIKSQWASRNAHSRRVPLAPLPCLFIEVTAPKRCRLHLLLSCSIFDSSNYLLTTWLRYSTSSQSRISVLSSKVNQIRCSPSPTAAEWPHGASKHEGLTPPHHLAQRESSYILGSLRSQWQGPSCYCWSRQ